MAGVNAYADYTRMNLCGTIVKEGLEAKNEASAILDTAIALSTIFHMIDWIRWTLLITSALVGVNLLSLFYFLSVINLPFGIITCAIAIITRFSDDGADCAMAGKQEMRSLFLALQVVCLIVYIPTCFAHIVYFKLRGVEWCH